MQRPSQGNIFPTSASRSQSSVPPESRRPEVIMEHRPALPATTAWYRKETPTYRPGLAKHQPIQPCGVLRASHWGCPQGQPGRGREQSTTAPNCSDHHNLKHGTEPLTFQRDKEWECLVSDTTWARDTTAQVISPPPGHRRVGGPNEGRYTHLYWVLRRIFIQEMEQ